MTIVRIVLYALIRAAWVTRQVLVSLVYEFLPVPLTPSRRTAVVELCRLSGSATLAGVIRISLSGPPPPNAIWSIALLIFAFLVALGIGTIVKETAFALSGHIANWVGNDFERTGMTLKGNLFSEIRCSDGTWCRSELRGGEIASEWTDWNGECHKLVFEVVEGLSAGERASVFSRLAPASRARRPHTRYRI